MGPLTINQERRSFLDFYGREVIFHGVNVVYK
jgi:hypothetical protein